jgi:hypothetical protein
LLVVSWYSVPQLSTGIFAPISYRIRYYLACLATERNPDPGLQRFCLDT